MIEVRRRTRVLFLVCRAFRLWVLAFWQDGQEPREKKRKGRREREKEKERGKEESNLAVAVFGEHWVLQVFVFVFR